MLFYRLIRIILAFAIAMTTGGLALLILSPLAGDTILAAILRFWKALAVAPEPGEVVQYTAVSLGRLLFLLLAAPVLLTGLIGLVARWRSGLWYIAGTALVTAAVPWLMRAELQPSTPGELRISAYLGIVGAITGLIYRLIAIPAGERRRGLDETDRMEQ